VRCAGFLRGQTIVLAYETEYKRHDGRAEMDTFILNLSMFIEHIFNQVHQSTLSA
jgi:hypothetical protein